MKQKITGRSELRSIRISLVLKIIITVWSLYVAVKSELFWQGIFYLAVSILFAGLFIFQLGYYRDKVKKGSE
jgi:heme/copper-type cytochrome/quinol oxidase subunit 4